MSAYYTATHCWQAGECTRKIRSTYKVTVGTVSVKNKYEPSACCWQVKECAHKIRSMYNVTVCTVPVTNI